MNVLRYTSLGSGSEGNALLIEATAEDGGSARLLLDCGFGLRDAARRLAERGVAPESLSAILVTHEHNDHVGGVVRLARKYGIAVHASHGTWAALRQSQGADAVEGVAVRQVCSHTAFRVGPIEIQPFPVPHDAREPTQFVFTHAGKRLGVLTDTGCATACIVEHLSLCDALVLECNHDPQLLARSDYPERLKRRIAGDYGHLSNLAAARLLEALDRSRLQRLHAAHLSRQNNRADLAAGALAEVMGVAASEIGVATQDTGFDWVALD